MFLVMELSKDFRTISGSLLSPLKQKSSSCKYSAPLSAISAATGHTARINIFTQYFTSCEELPEPGEMRQVFLQVVGAVGTADITVGESLQFHYRACWVMLERSAHHLVPGATELKRKRVAYHHYTYRCLFNVNMKN